MFPRPHSRGLIEASDTRSRPRTRQSRFRGLTAAASLKHHLHRAVIVQDVRFRGLTAAASLKLHGFRHDLLHRRRFPRPHSRGLIEASMSPCMRATIIKFPRPHSRGLIEAPKIVKDRIERMRFRGLTAAASLKLSRCHARPRPLFRFPRPHSRGLIEARGQLGGQA